MDTRAILVFLCLLALAASLPTTTRPNFPCICTMEYAPVCGVDGKTYGNKCSLNCVGILEAHVGECSPLCLCTKIYQPVCGKDGKTYGNPCMMNCAGVEISHEGTCDGSAEDPLPVERKMEADSTPVCICPFIYMPVCGIDGVTYPNKCNMECVKITMDHEGPCGLPTRPPLTKPITPERPTTSPPPITTTVV